MLFLNQVNSYRYSHISLKAYCSQQELFDRFGGTKSGKINDAMVKPIKSLSLVKVSRCGHALVNAFILWYRNTRMVYLLVSEMSTLFSISLTDHHIIYLWSAAEYSFSSRATKFTLGESYGIPVHSILSCVMVYCGFYALNHLFYSISKFKTFSLVSLLRLEAFGMPQYIIDIIKMLCYNTTTVFFSDNSIAEFNVPFSYNVEFS